MRVALTFDTEPELAAHFGEPVIDLILDALSARGVRATFFLQGSWVAENPDRARRLVADGHRLGNHTYSHALPGRIGADELRAEIARCEEVVGEVTGASTVPLFRCPQSSGAFDPKVLATIRSAGYSHVGWSADSFDWHDGIGADEIVSNVLRGLDAHGDGTVVLLHSWVPATAAALPVVLDRLAALGAEFVAFEDAPTLCTCCRSMQS